jgi:NADPH-dependent glutamate synthase beta subunit-like oxidoreductase
VEGAEAPNVVTATAFLKAFNDGRMQHVGKRVVVVGGGDTSIDVATVARRLGHIDQIHESDRPENAIAGFAAHDAASLSRRQGAEVTLTSIFADRQDAGQQARGGTRGGRRHRHPRRHGAGGRAARARRPRHRRCA